MEETTTHNAKVSDSAYSNSCNSQSQHSSSSSKSRHSNSSGSSSGYCGHPSTLSSGNEPFPQPTVSKRNKDKEHKKKKQKTCTTSSTSSSTPPPEAAPARPSQTTSVSTSDNVTRSDCSIASSNNVALGGSGALGVGLGGATIPGPENEALQIATISQTLSCIQKLKAKELPEVIPEETEGQTVSVDSLVADKNEEQILSCLQIEQKIQPTDPVEFCAIVSMHDGVVMHTSASLSQVLGFPKDMWLGRSFIDFVHAGDRIAFASHITSGVGTPFVADADSTAQSSNKNSFFCRLRRYRGLKSSGFGVTEKKVTYLPFHLTLAFRELSSAPTTSKEAKVQTIILVVSAKLVQTVYTYAEETRVSPKFVTKHLPSCLLSHVDPEVVPHLGYLPQDMINHSVVDFYHPEDLPFLKEVYEAVMKEKGSLFRSKPYRFRTQNGDYVLLETEWSSFINPWTRKLEFVIGQHRVLKGPTNPNVFAPPREDDTQQISEEVLKESKIIEEEIKSLLQNPISRSTKTARQQVSKRCKDLANFMDTLMDEITAPNLRLDLPPQEETSFSERDSAMLGEISPHHDYYDSKSSSETPPSYNQLNYNENIQRFFESKPKTTVSDESSESKMEVNQSLPSTDEEGKSVPVADSSLGSTTATNRKCRSPVNGSGSGSGSGCSGSGGVTGSAGSHGDTSQTNTNSNRSYRPHHLTEALLYRHNEDMEKRMVQKHREQRSKGGDRESKMKKSNLEKFQEQCQGLKRSGSHSWEGAEHFKAAKQSHMAGNICPKETVLGELRAAGVGTAAVNNVNKQYVPATNPGNIAPVFQGTGNVNLWPPFSVSVTPFNHTQQPSSTPGGYSSAGLNAQPPMIPVYYIPSQPSQPSGSGAVQGDASPQGPPRVPTQLPLITQQVPYMSGIPGLAYYPIHPMYGGPVVYPSMTVLQPASMMPAVPVHQHKPDKVDNMAHGGMSKFQQPPSQATSVKAEPGSAMGSIASASIKRCMSECSKKEMALFSPEGRTSPNMSQDENKPKASVERNNENSYSVMRDTEDDSCFSSFYSFLKTEKSDESIMSGPDDKPNYTFAKREDDVWEKMDAQNDGSRERPRPVLHEPPWLEQVTVTTDLVYRYQVQSRTLEDILDADRKALMSTRQPVLVNDQLSQFYVDMELEGLTTKLMLEEGLTTSSSSGEDGYPDAKIRLPLHKSKKKRRSVEYGKITMIFEENAPLPPPVVTK